MYPAHLRGPRLLYALARYHTLLRLIALGAPAVIVSRSQELVNDALARAGTDEVTLAQLYPSYRLGHIEIPFVEDN